MDPRAVTHRYGDLLLAGILATLMTGELLAWRNDVPVAALVLGLLATLPLALRRRVPLASFLLVMAGIELLALRHPGFDNDSMAFVVAFFFSLYSLGRHARGLEGWLGAGGVVLAMGLFVHSEDGLAADLGDVAFVIAFAGAPWAAGLALRLKQEREVVLNEENSRLREVQEERARRAVAEERSRIARELHDVVSHAISVTVLQARGARATLGRDEAQVRRALDAIEHTNTAALGDMRRLLAVLRDTEGAEADGTTEHAPAPSLEHLPMLLGHVRESGLPVELQVVGAPVVLPPGVDLSAYRIVQEALTNVLKHAVGARATVQLRYSPEALEIAVADDGTAAHNGTPASGGHGLIGIRERVSVVGGEVTAGPREQGGFEISARLPYSVEPG